MSKISFVYFDVGGVAIRDFSDSDKWAIMLNKIGVKDEQKQELDKIYHDFELGVCKGEHHVDELVPIFRKKFALPIPKNYSLQEYMLDHFETNPGIWPIVSKLKQVIKIGLLTDQYPGLLSGINDRQLLPPIAWDQIVDSSKVGLKKPMLGIYELAENLAGVPAQEILFIDNREKNLVPARERGWQTFIYDSKNYDQANRDLTAYLKNIL